jgi:iron complex transport system permease protein
MRKIAICFAILLGVAILSPVAGSAHISLRAALAGASPDHEIFFFARLPRVLLSLLAGAGLAVTGVVFQAILRDPLAEPYTLGVSSGASVGAVLAVCLSFSFTGVSALLGAVAVMAVVLGMATEGRRMSSFTLLLTGVTMNSLCFAIILFLHSVASFSQSFAISRWLMGGLDAVEYSTLAWFAPVVLAVSGVVIWFAPAWNLLAVGEDWATSRGVDAGRYTILGFLAGSILTAVITSLCGPIGFVGLIVPHALRLWVGADHRVLLPCSFLLGAAFLGLCDTLARIVLSPVEIPVGVVTAICGAPFFLWLLKTRRRSAWQ